MGDDTEDGGYDQYAPSVDDGVSQSWDYQPSQAILYVSIPDTHKQYESITDEALTSIRPA